MCVSILLRKDGKFPQTEVGENDEMKKRGIKCMKEDEHVIGRRSTTNKGYECSGNYSEACSSCGFYPYEKEKLQKKDN